jgi:hypothetical protein
MSTLDEITKEKQRVSEALARVDAQREKLTGQLGELEATERVLARPANGRYRRSLAIGAQRADGPHPRRNRSFGKLACRLIGGAGSGTVGIEEATMHTSVPLPVPCKPAPWNKGRLIGQKRPLKPKDVWAIRVRLQLQGRKRDLALFNLAIDSKLRGCDLVRLQVDDVCAGGRVRDRGTVIQKKRGRPVEFEITEQTRASIRDWLSKVELRNGRYLFPSRFRAQPHLSARQYARIVHAWVESAGLDSSAYGTHSMRRTKGGADLQKDR